MATAPLPPPPPDEDLPALAARFQQEGYALLPALLPASTLTRIRGLLEDPDGLRKYAYRGTTKMASFSDLSASPADALGRFARSRRLHALAAAVLGQQGPEDVQLHHVQVTGKDGLGGLGWVGWMEMQFSSIDSRLLTHSLMSRRWCSRKPALPTPSPGTKTTGTSLLPSFYPPTHQPMREDQSSPIHTTQAHPPTHLPQNSYHYHGHVLEPRMCTFVVAIDPCLPTNGGLEIIARSHLCGRLEHRPRDETTRQLEADRERVKALLEEGGGGGGGGGGGVGGRRKRRFERVALSLAPGDAVVFHANTLHQSEANGSDVRRYALNITFNCKDNLPLPPPPSSSSSSSSLSHSLPYALVEKGEEEEEEGRGFEPAAWGMPPIPLLIHEALEAWRDGEEEEAVRSGVFKKEEEFDFVKKEDGCVGIRHAECETKEITEAILYKVRALKLKALPINVYEDEDDDGEPRWLLLKPRG